MSHNRRSGLLTIEASLDRVILASHYIGPPIPVTDTEQSAWMVDFNISNSPPVLAKWVPPWYVDRCNAGSGFMLNDQTACFQRGYCPDEVYRAILPVLADGFNHNADDIERTLRDLDYDFIIVIRNKKTREVAAICMVEVRCGRDKDDIPNIFVFELTTNKNYGRHGLAQQLTHAVDALAYFLKSDPDKNNIWYNTLKDKRLFTSLTVAKDQDESNKRNLIKLYSRAGFRIRSESTPSFDYGTFTPYSSFDWKIDRDRHYIAMWKEILPNALYSDDSVTIWKSNHMGEKKIRSYYHPFPIAELDNVKSHGIVHPLHRCLHGAENVYVPVGDKIRFSCHLPPMPYFELLAECGSDSFQTHISIPKWFALSIQL
jgi:hypothetical protein